MILNITLLATKSIESIFTEGGAMATGSLALFGFIMVVGLVLLMFYLNIPAALCMMFGGLVLIGMMSTWSNIQIFKIVLSIIAVIIGAGIGIFVMKVFNSSSK